MAHETTKNIIRSKLPAKEACSSEVMKLLDELYKVCRYYHTSIVLPLRSLEIAQRRMMQNDARVLKASGPIKEILAKLREKNISLLGLDAMDFCEAYLEVYFEYTGKHTLAPQLKR